MRQDGSLPSVDTLFGAPPATPGNGTDEAHTVYSPAAYLADPLRQLSEAKDDGTVDPPAGIAARRPNILSVPLDAENTTTEVPVEWFERVNRFVRLARRTGRTLTDLDLVLRNCCDNRIDTAALRTIAIVVHLRTVLNLPFDVVVNLVAPMDSAGFASGPQPRDLFDRVHNVPFAATERTFLRGSARVPPAYITSTDIAAVTPENPLTPRAGTQHRSRKVLNFGRVDAALVTKHHTFLMSYGSHIRYTNRSEPEYGDPVRGFPLPISGGGDDLPRSRSTPRSGTTARANSSTTRTTCLRRRPGTPRASTATGARPRRRSRRRPSTPPGSHGRLYLTRDTEVSGTR